MLRVAIVGTGNISKFHIEGYLTFPARAKIVALVDIFPQKAEDKKKAFGLTDADVYDNYEKILGRDDIDLVDICVPPYVHAEIAIGCLRAGKNVLVEKPMAASVKECDEMIKAERESGKLLTVVAQNRFRSGYWNLKKVLDSGLAGDIVHAEADSFWWRGHSYYDLWWRGTWAKEGGGCTLNHAVHHIDLMLWMMGMPEEVTSVMGNTSHDNAEVEDISMSLLRFKNGSFGQLTASVVHHGEDQQIVLQGKNARISAPWKVYASAAKQNGFPEEDPETEKKIQAYYESLPEQKYENHTPLIDNVLTALETGAKPLISAEDGRRTVELISAIYESATTHKPVRLPLSSDDPFYTVEGIQANAPHFHEKTASVDNFSDESISTGRAV
jgi:UDP-N-acetyl-2-amino-2-deoxyglucuronate dehydrogenase